jgi:hypothetical protein
VVANLSGGDFTPVAVGGGFVVTGTKLTAWRPQLLSARRSVNEQPGGVAISSDGRACATVAVRPALGLHAFRLPMLEPIATDPQACNGSVTISGSGKLVACTELRVENDAATTSIRVFSFPALKPVQSIGPITESLEALSFVGGRDERLAVALTTVMPPRRPEDYRSRIDFYDARSGARVADVTQPGRFPYLAFAPAGDVFAWAGQQGAQLWSLRSQARVRAFAPTQHTIAVALSPDASLLAASRTDEGVQVFDTRSGELLAEFGSADLKLAAHPRDSDEMLSERPRVQVRFELLGATLRDGQLAFGDVFGGPGQLAPHTWLGFLQNDTLVSAGRGFFALWTLNQPAVRKARGLE